MVRSEVCNSWCLLLMVTASASVIYMSYRSDIHFHPSSSISSTFIHIHPFIFVHFHPCHVSVMCHCVSHVSVMYQSYVVLYQSCISYVSVIYQSHISHISHCLYRVADISVNKVGRLGVKCVKNTVLPNQVILGKKLHN